MDEIWVKVIASVIAGAVLPFVGKGLIAVYDRLFRDLPFIKGKWKTGEDQAAQKYFRGRIKFYPMGDGFTWETQNFSKDVAAAKKAWAKCLEFLHDDKHGLVIFDEINYVLKYNFLDVKEVVRELKKKPVLKHVFLTGGGAPPEIIEIADLVTEMKCIKHPYHKGIKAQQGIEF